MQDDIQPPEKRARLLKLLRRALWVLVGLAVLEIVISSVWKQRIPIADNYISSALAEKGVRANYRLTRISLRTQRIENVVFGDPARPDLTARWVEVDIGYRGVVPAVSAVRAEGVRLHGRFADGKLSLGALDKFRSTTSTAPFSLPNIHLTVRDGRARIETPLGPVGVALAGSGNLASGFRGSLGALMRDVAVAGCASPKLSAYLDIRVVGGAPRLAGPVRAGAVGCPGMEIAASDVNAEVDTRFSANLDRLSGRVQAKADALRAQGALLSGANFDVHFDGGGNVFAGRYGVGSQILSYGSTRAAAVRSEGTWNYAPSGSRINGQLRAQNVQALDARTIREMRSAASGTPVAPLLGRLADALEASGRNNVLRAAFDARQAGGKGDATLSSFDLTSRSGAHIALSNGGNVRFEWPGGRWAMTGSAISEGGGLPQAALHLSQVGRGIEGQLFLEPYAAGGARLAVEPVRFVAGAGGTTRVVTQMRLDGPLGSGGSLRGFTVPLVASFGGGTFRLNPGCTPVRFDSLSAGSLRLGANRMSLCALEPAGLISVAQGGALRGGGTLGPLRLNGTMGQSAASLSASRASYRLGTSDFALADARLALGSVILSAKQLNGRTVAGGFGGAATGIEAQIGNIPLLVREGAGGWSYLDDKLGLTGSIEIIDAANPDRFNPLAARDFVLAMANGRIEAKGTLSLATGSAPIARLAIAHVLENATGSADIAVDGLRFDPALQPDQITRLALGVVANVRGTVNGSGKVRWVGDRVSSEGIFETNDTDLAAAFGPVTGLATRVQFTDLIGLVTAPSQIATMKTANPGVEVRDGRIAYSLRANQQVAVESGRWPFAGGELLLLPSVMDFSADKPRNLTFRVLGLDAGAFINTLELENISATGTYDGLLPIVFDSAGGRIVGGVMVARQVGMPPLVIDHVEGLSIPCDRTRQAGTLSYVGQVSNENLGRFGKLAFDALKDLQYKCLTILMDGALDGEVVTQVSFNGVNRGELSAVPQAISRQFIGLPFIFNIRIEAPFRGLINTARSFVDPSLLIRSQLGSQFEPVIQNRLAVQPRESETTITGDQK